MLPICFPAPGSHPKLSIIYLIFNNKVSPVAYDLKPRAAPGKRPAGTMTGLREARWTGTGPLQVTPEASRVPGSAFWS